MCNPTHNGNWRYAKNGMPASLFAFRICCLPFTVFLLLKLQDILEQLFKERCSVKVNRFRFDLLDNFRSTLDISLIAKEYGAKANIQFCWQFGWVLTHFQTKHDQQHQTPNLTHEFNTNNFAHANFAQYWSDKICWIFFLIKPCTSGSTCVKWIKKHTNCSVSDDWN